ncbi:MAG: TolC family outer membrane protein [Hyphomicrobiales bacterium]
MGSKQYLFIAILLAIVSFTPFDVSAESLHSALTSAYSNNPTLNAARAAQRAQNENVSQALAGRRPTISATTSLGGQSSSSSLTGGFGEGDFSDDVITGNSAVTITQNLFNGFQITNNVKSAQAGVKAGIENLRNTEQNTLQSAVTAYVDVLRDRKILNLQGRNTQFSREQLRASEALAEVGEGTRTDVALAQANLADSLSDLAAAKSTLRSSEATYDQIIGKRPGKLSSPTEATRFLPKSLKAALSVARENHPLIKAAQYNVDAGQFNVKVSEGTLLPSVTLDANYQRALQRGTTVSDSSSSTVTANVSFPIYQGGARFSNIRQAKETVSQLRIQVDEARRQIDQAVHASYAQLQSARSQTRSAKTNVSASQIALNGLVEERKVGEATTLDVLNAQSNLITAQVALANARRDTIVASYSLLSSIGDLTGDRIDIAKGTNVVSTEIHYKKVRDKWFGLRTTSGN